MTWLKWFEANMMGTLIVCALLGLPPLVGALGADGGPGAF